MPFMMIFWQDKNTINVGIDATTNPALTSQGISFHQTLA